MNLVPFNLEEFKNGRVAYTEFDTEARFLTTLENPSVYKRIAVKLAQGNYEILDTCNDRGYLFNSQVYLFFKPNTMKLTTVYYYYGDYNNIYVRAFLNSELGIKNYVDFISDDSCNFDGRIILSTTETEITVE